jgi:hypothetical protein
MYWLEFVDKKPVRKPFEIHKPAPKPQGDQKVKQAWALIVYNYNTSKIEVCEITQVTIKLAIENYLTKMQNGEIRLLMTWQLTRQAKGLILNTL